MPTTPQPHGIAPAAVALVRRCEGLYLTAYLCPAGVPTIGYGHTAGVTMGDVITPADAETLLAQDLLSAARDVDRLVTVPLTPEQRGALASFVFNLGAGSLASSTLLRLLNAGRPAEEVAEQFGRWIYATVGGVKRPLPGLVARRAAEAALFSGGAVDLPGADQQPQMARAPDGEDDDRVQRIQRIVGVAVDGVYGPATRAAVQRWQEAHGLVADGIVGPKTAFAMGIE